MEFVSVDVETANANMSSICQIGLVQFRDGIETGCQKFLVNPETWFDAMNIQIHGIRDEDVVGQPIYTEIFDQIAESVEGKILVCHTHFDRVALKQASQKYSLNELNCQWLDSARVSRRTWDQFAKKGYGLKNIANHLGIEFKHHDALEDARTAGKILIEAIQHSGVGLSDWLVRVERGAEYVSHKRVGDGDGALVGETITFTGALQIPRREAADLAAEAGGDVATGVTKKTSLLVVGDQDIDRLAGKEKSSKHLKAEKMIADGQAITIIGETDFLVLSSIKS